MKIGYFGAGTWGFALATLLASKGHEIVVWTRNPAFAERLGKTRIHPKLADSFASNKISFTSSLKETLDGAEFLIESVTASGLRPLLENILKIDSVEVPFVITSKGIEQNTSLLLPEVALSLLGHEKKHLIGILSGPSHAEEVIHNLPASLVASAFDASLIKAIHELFVTPTFRVYPNTDIAGVAFGGAMKNIIAIACGISDGLGYGDNTKAALLTRGLHEIRKLAVAKHCHPETLNGLSGLGDLIVTSMSRHSRNYKFGKLLAGGFSPEEAKLEIGMAVEGIYSCVSARDLGRQFHIPIPITEGAYSIIYESLDPKEAVRSLLQRAIKEEHL
jgi:glycerol-3-phosphate dehydrogenase (NAD(P)+)